MTDGKCIRVWEFDDAPQELRSLTTNGGDEDWIAVLPPGTSAPMWAAEGTPFGCCCVDRHELPDGRVVLIGCHA